MPKRTYTRAFGAAPKRGVTKKRNVVRRRFIPRGISPLGQVVTIKRSYYSGSLASNGNTAQNFTGLGLSFNVSDLPNYTEFSNLFDQYRIRWVAIRVIPINNVAYANTEGVQLPDVLAAVDMDDATAPVDLNAMHQYSNCVVFGAMAAPRTIGFRPAIAGVCYQGATAVGYTVRQNDWVNMANLVPWYGIKFGVHNELDHTAITYKYRLFITLTMEFRGIR